MAVMMGAPSNRIRWDVDNPIDSDGFYRFVSSAPNKRAGRMRRRVIRRREGASWRREFDRGER